MSPLEVQDFLQALQDAGVWELGAEFCGTGSQQSLHFSVDDRLHQVPAYQSSCENEASTESKVNSFLVRGLPGRVAEDLYRRAEQKNLPDGPLLVPGQEVDFDAWRERSPADQEIRVSNREVIPCKDTWPSDKASLFLLRW